MSLDMSSFDAALKEYYSKDKVENLVYKDNPLLMMIDKVEDFGGEHAKIALIYGNPQNRSATFSTGQGGTSTSQIKAFLVTRVKDYAFANIDGETLQASKGNSNAFMQAATTECDGAINTLTRSLAIAMYGSGWGDIGVIAAAGISGAVITLATRSDVTHFEPGMVLNSASTQTASSVNSGSVTVLSVDPSLGTVTMTGNVTSGIASAAAGDYLFAAGDRSGSAALKVSGLEAWVPVAAPSSSLFFNVDRTPHVSRLGGQRLDGRNLPLEEVLIDGASLVGREGGKLSHYFVSFGTYAALEKALGSKVQYVDVGKKSIDIGFTGIRILGPRGPIDVVPDMNCPDSRAFGLDLDMWSLMSIGKAIRPIDDDGNQWLRQGTADGLEVRYGFKGNVVCRAPGRNVNIRLA